VTRGPWMNKTIHHFETDTLIMVGPLTITYYGQAAKTEGRFFWKATYDGKPKINGEYNVTDIWIKRDGRWQVMLRMSMPAAIGK